MKRLVLSLLCSLISLPARSAPNELVGFLVGHWDNVSFEVSDGNPVKREAYSESMRLKNDHTLTITAHGYRDGKDLTKDMELKVEGDQATLRQGGASWRGALRRGMFIPSED